MKTLTLPSLLACLLSIHASARAVEPVLLFQDNAIIQRDKPVPVWGKAAPGEAVTVEFGGQRVSCTADRKGRWQATLAPMEASARPQDMVIHGKESVTIHNVLIGDVWLCSGQSNMVFKIGDIRDYEKMLSGHSDQIRTFIHPIAVAETPSDEMRGTWVIDTESTVKNFSAVSYFFAQEINVSEDVPVGLIVAARNGSKIVGWLPPEAIDREPLGAVEKKRWQATLDSYERRYAQYQQAQVQWNARKAKAEKEGKTFNERAPKPPQGKGGSATPSGLYNAMVYANIPYAIRGFLWYQGEGNVSLADEYAESFLALIRYWRENFGQGDLPFYWIQLPDFNQADSTGVKRALLREAQAEALALPNTGQVVMIDTNEKDDNHPQNKDVVGHRLARLALAQSYGQNIVVLSPVCDEITFNGQEVVVRFETHGSHLTVKGGELTEFELAGEDHVFHPARAELRGADTVVVTATDVPRPTAVRYAFHNAPSVTLFNREGLPATPFRSDNWR